MSERMRSGLRRGTDLRSASPAADGSPWAFLRRTCVARPRVGDPHKGGAPAARSAGVLSAGGLDSFMGLLSVDGVLVEANRMPPEREHLSARDALGGPVWRAAWWAWSPAAQQRGRDAVACAATGVVAGYRDTLRVSGGGLVTFDIAVVPVAVAGRVTSLMFSAVNVDNTPEADQPAGADIGPGPGESR